MKSSGITLIAEERATQRRRTRVHALGWIVATALSLGAIYTSADAIHLSLENHSQGARQVVQR
jgi:hypothetical protein